MITVRVPLIVVAVTGLLSSAQGQDLRPVVRVSVTPVRVVVGQPATLRIDVLAPNYMTAPPELPDFQLRNAITRPLPGRNLSEPHGDMTYAGVRFEFALYPQEPGNYELSGQKLTVHFAADPPQSRTETEALSKIAFSAFIPDAAAQLDPFVSANALVGDQQVKRSSQELKVGDSLTRTVTVKADGTPAMLLPPVVFQPVDGLVVYPAQPSLQQTADRRTGHLTATRIDAATYMLERAGDYQLPSVELRWWSVTDGKIETTRFDPIDLHVADNPAAVRAPRPSWGDIAATHWRTLVVAAAALLALLWTARPAARRIATWHRRRRAARLASEPHAFRCALAAGCGRDPRRFYLALLDWTARLEPAATITSLRAQNRTLDRKIAGIEASLFAPSAPGARLPSVGLLIGLLSARRNLRGRAARGDTVHGLPRSLNPEATRISAYRRRRVAR